MPKTAHRRKRIAPRAVVLLLLLIPAWGRSQIRESPYAAFDDDLDRDSLHRAIHRSLEFLQRLPPDRTVGEWPKKITAREVKESLLDFIEQLNHHDRPEDFLEALRANFDLFDPAGPKQEALVTGYYAPVLSGSLAPSQKFPLPIYGKPKDLVEGEFVTLRPERRAERFVARLSGERLVPYFSRREIDSLGLLKDQGYEIAWVGDPMELFFLHIQGSGLLRLDDGRHLYLNYAASNGRPYTSIGRFLIDSGRIGEEDLSMQRLRHYLSEHPGEREALFEQNERYIFFRFVQNGPLGSLEVPLTPGRSIATDARLFPKGALALIVSRRPIVDAAGNVSGWQPFSRFVLNQDTGAAIQGPLRVDLYFGAGNGAGMAAGAMKSAGKIYFLFKKEVKK